MNGLVEIIKTKKTSAETLSCVFDFIRKINKIPIIVNDSPDFTQLEYLKSIHARDCSSLRGYPLHLIESTSKNVS